MRASFGIEMVVWCDACTDGRSVRRLMVSAVFVLLLLLTTSRPLSASPAADQDASNRIDSAGTVIIGGSSCQLIALDDGRFVALQSGALPKNPLPIKARIKIVAEPASSQSCPHAQSVEVKAFHHLPDLIGR